MKRFSFVNLPFILTTKRIIGQSNMKMTLSKKLEASLISNLHNYFKYKIKENFKKKQMYKYILKECNLDENTPIVDALTYFLCYVVKPKKMTYKLYNFLKENPIGQVYLKNNTVSIEIKQTKKELKQAKKEKKNLKQQKKILNNNYVTEKHPFTLEEYRENSKEFYKSKEWRELRFEVLKENGGHCCLCGRGVKDGVVLHVDHIIPLSKDWSKRLDKDNLQVLCEDCNIGKSNKDNTDWR